MSTFGELQKKLNTLHHKQEILSYVSEHLEENFTSSSGVDPKKKLLDENRTVIPVTAFEEILVDISLQIEAVKSQIEEIMSAGFDQVTVAPQVKKTPKKSENVQGEKS